MQFVPIKAALLCAGLSLLLVPPSTSQEQMQCTLPTDQDVMDVADELFEALQTEGMSLLTVQNLFKVQFTCLARVAKDMYAFAAVIANFTTTASNAFEQFQLRCDGGAWMASTTTSFKPRSLPYNETQYQCSECEELPASTPNYDPDSYCLCECEIGG